jgi:short-subunit dehydrogenase involved in D-alanine esterification of teichoic acids
MRQSFLSEFQRSLLPQQGKTSAQKVQYYSVVVIFVGCILGFVSMRFAELASLCTTNPMLHGVMSLIVLFSIGSFFVKPSNSVLGMIRKMALLALVVHQIKKGMDGDLRKGLERRNLQGSVAIVTGGNSGIGFAVVEQLLSHNSTVVMTCRSEIKCRIAASKLKKLAKQNITVVYGDRESTNVPFTSSGEIVPQLHLMTLDLEDLHSVRNFVYLFSGKFRNLDILINNAGSFIKQGSRTKDGLEASIGGMHIGHFALTKWLTKLMIKPAFPSANDNTYYPARVINII